MVYSELTASEEGLYLPNLVDPHGHLVYTASFDSSDRSRRQRVLHSTGFQRVADPEPENRERIAHVYLPPLRDAVTALDSARGERLHEIFLLLTEDEIDSFRLAANDAMKDLAGNPVAQKVVTGVQRHLTSITQPVRHRRVDVLHRDQKLRALLRALRLHMAGVGLELADLAESGLGYANLLFVATVVMELERASDFDLVLLLVEEPEAHLHPQLQSVLLDYLQEQAELSAQDGTEAALPTGRIQVVATTHSPQLASSVSSTKIVVLRAEPHAVGPDQASGVAEPPESHVTAAADPAKHYPTTFAVPLGSVELAATERRKVDRYLDATRASLLFARQLMLVEGVAEAVLIRTLAERIVFPPSRDNDENRPQNREKREQFRAVSILPIGGVDFLPYLRLLLHKGRALADRIVVVTDGDRGAGQGRRAAIEEEFAEHVTSQVLHVKVGSTTLEAELYALLHNEEVLRTAFEQQHPRSLEKWDAISQDAHTPQERAQAFASALRSKELDLGKGDFAHVVAGVLESGERAFVVPKYLSEAISAVILPVG